MQVTILNANSACFFKFNRISSEKDFESNAAKGYLSFNVVDHI